MAHKRNTQPVVGTPIVYTAQSIAQLRERFKPGQQFVIRKASRGSTNLVELGNEYGRYTVQKVYPHIVDCLDSHNQHESFGFVQLAQETKMM